MAEEIGSRDRVTKWIRWIARIWSVPIIVFALLFLVGSAWNLATTGVADPHAVEGYPWTEALPPILMFVSILGLGIAWRWERLGAIIALVFQLAVIVTLLIQTPIARDFPRTAMPYVLWVIVTIPGVLFFAAWWRSK
jgi:phosphatidylserine synthase